MRCKVQTKVEIPKTAPALGEVRSNAIDERRESRGFREKSKLLATNPTKARLWGGKEGSAP
jgi:hypothetical protein